MTGPDFEQRPWGHYEVINRFPLLGHDGVSFDVVIKKIVVEPGKRLSYQSHQGRTEHWYIISGVGSVVINGVESLVKPGDAVDVPKGFYHRIGAHADTELVFIEVATGQVDEHDIVRHEDDFGRADS